MAQHGGEHGDDLEVYQVVLSDQVVVLHQFDDRHGHESFQEIEREDRQGGPPAQHAEHVGRSGVLRAVLADVDAVIFLADPYGAWNRTEQIGDDNHGGSRIYRQNHLFRVLTCSCKYSQKIRMWKPGAKKPPPYPAFPENLVSLHSK